MKVNAITLLCTRPVDPRLVAIAASRSIQLDVIPFIETVPVNTEALYEAIHQAALLPSTVIFTSMNAADAVINALNGVVPQWTVFCVGKSTKEKLTGYFGEDKIAGAAVNARELADLINTRVGISEVMFFCGDQRREELPSMLGKKNIRVQELVVYHTIPIPKETGIYSGVLFFSPSAVESYFSINKPISSAVYFAIGETTAASIKHHTDAQVIVAREPGAAELVLLAIEYFS